MEQYIIHKHRFDYEKEGCLPLHTTYGLFDTKDDAEDFLYSQLLGPDFSVMPYTQYHPQCAALGYWPPFSSYYPTNVQYCTVTKQGDGTWEWKHAWRGHEGSDPENLERLRTIREGDGHA